MSNSTATNLESLRLLYDGWLTAYRAAVTAIATVGPKPNYSVGGQSVSWQEVYTNGPRVLKDLRELIVEMSWSAGPVDSYSRP